MANLTVLSIGGTAVNLPRDVVLGTLVPYTREGYPTLDFAARGGPLPVPPYPYLGKEVILTINATTYFKGDCRAAHPSFQAGLGWVIAYSCRGLADRLMRMPHTDANTGTDSSVYNASPEDTQNYLPARAGRTVGQIISDVLSFKAVGDMLTAYGIGNLTYVPASGTYTLPSATVTDLAALSVVPPAPVYFSGERFYHALQGLLSDWAPNHMLHIEPGGDIRVFDQRTFTNHTFTMGTDPIEPAELSRDTGDCFQRVAVRGAPIAIMALLKTSDGTLQENFIWGSYATNAAAKAAWTPGQFHQPSAQDTGTCTCGDTLHVTVTSSNASYTWSSDFWDQTSTGRHGVINLQYSAATGVDMFWTARIVANTALAAGGTSVLTVDAPLPHLNFNRYTITGLTQQDGSIVWRKYKITNTALWPKVTNQSTFPQPFVNPGGGATLTSTPMGAVLWPISGTSPPYNMFPLPWNNYDGAGNIYFTEPTYTAAQNAQPSDVWALVPYYASVNQVAAPADVAGVAQYAGTTHTVELMSDTLYITVNEWRDPANATNMAAYAADVLDSVKDAVIEGSILYHGLFEGALTPGMAVSVTGVDFTSGWEGAAIPVTGVELTWTGSPTSWMTVLHASSRRAHYSAAFFLRPERGFQAIGGPEGGVFGGMEAAYSAALARRQYATPGDLAPQYTGEIPDVGFVTPEAGRPASRTPEEQEASHHAAVEARQQQLEQRRQAEADRAARVAMEAEQRQGLPGGLVGVATPEQVAAITARGQEQRAQDVGQAADITAREQARAARAREDVTSSAPQIRAAGLAQREKELGQGREVGTREQARVQIDRARREEIAHDERQRAADSAAIQETRGSEMVQEQSDISEEKRRRREEGETSDTHP